VVALNKTSNKLRFCIDYRELNEYTETYMYPLPNIPDTIRSLKGKSLFANLDMKLGFHQLLIKEEDRKWTTFITTKGVYRWKRLPFGPKNGPMFFQHVMRSILGDYVDTICKIFIDDICVFTDNNTEEELIHNIDKILTRLAEHNVRLSLSKCSFGNDNVKYLGYVVNEHGKQLPDSRVDGILKLAAPTTVKEVRGLLGMTNQFREYIKDYTTIISPINELTKKGTPFHWNNECAMVFDTL
jgi:hypothetical protein